MNPIFGIMLVAAGLFSAAGGYFNWEWFMNNRKARSLSAIITRTGARIFYIVIGLGVAVLGILFATGIVEKQS